jgi:hypothetical protein
MVPNSAAFSNLASEKPPKPWISGEESDGEIAEMLPPRESVFDPENPDDNLGSTLLSMKMMYM